MGALKDKARAQSKFLSLERGEFAIVQLVSYKFIPSELDPTVEVALFEVKWNGQTKFWKNGSGKVLTALDAANPGDWIKISRHKFLNKKNEEDPNKSNWQAELLPGYDPKTGQTPASAPNVPQNGSQASANAILEEAGKHMEGPAAEKMDPFAA